MSNQEQIRSKTLAAFNSLLSKWANSLRKDLTTMQDAITRQFDFLQERMAEYQEKLDEGEIVALVEELSKPAAGKGAAAGKAESLLSQVRRSMAQLEQGASPTGILTQLVDEVAQMAPRAALFIIPPKDPNVCKGWYGQGFDQSPGFSNDAVKKTSVPVNADTVFRAVMTSRKSFLGESTAHRENAHLLTRLGNVLPTNLFAVPIVLRDKVTAILYTDSGDSREPLQATEGIEILVSYTCKLIDLLTGAGRAVGKSTAELQADKLDRVRELAAAPATDTHEQTGPFRAAAREIRSQLTPAPEAITSPPAAKTSPSLAQPTPPPAAIPAPAAAKPMDSESRKQHEDAKRFARLLVSEIKLYNEAKVQLGRKNRDLYDLLKDDIERSRQLYFERVPPSVRANSNYFNEELVRILADGDPGVLGHPL